MDREQIEAVVALDQVPFHAGIHDFGDAAILPGLVDSHLHINDPGRAEWEGFETATRAAAAGGYTFLVDMPLNCLPATTVAALEAKREAARSHCRVDWAAWGGVVGDNQGDIEALAAAGVLGFKCFLIDAGIDGFTMVTEQELRRALPHVARTGLPLLVHAEVAGPVDAATKALADADWRSYATYLKSRPDQAELSAIRLLLLLCREYSFRLHIVHLSTCLAIPELKAARAERLPISVETCPHYLHLAAETIADGATLRKCAPPIRSRENREALWQGLRDGAIDMVATDHSPCLPAMKRLEEGNFKTAWGGIASLSLALPLMWTEANQRGFTLSDIALWMAEGPARLAGFGSRKGRIAAGYDADLVVFDADAEFVVTEDVLNYRHAVTPYEPLGAEVKIDATGNLRAFYPAAESGEQRLLIGSHLDTVPNAGAYDGVLGVVLAIALLEDLKGQRLPFGIEVVGFSEEEGVRFGTPFIGSRALVGRLDDELLKRRDSNGICVRQAIEEFGLKPDEIPDAIVSDDALGFVEFHIEQGPVLEQIGRPLGVVEAIVGGSRLEFTFVGRANHAGTAPMHLRYDAIAAAAEWITSVEREGQRISGLVATVGQVEAKPGTTNVIAGEARLTLDVRHSSDDVRMRTVEALMRKAEEIAERRKLLVRWETIMNQGAVAMNPFLIRQTEEAIRKTGCEPHRMVSGAGHDAMILAEKVPSAMIFLRTPGGISHAPEETVEIEDVAKAIESGLHLLDLLASSHAVQRRT